MANLKTRLAALETARAPAEPPYSFNRFYGEPDPPWWAERQKLRAGKPFTLDDFYKDLSREQSIPTAIA